ncbi:MAG: hypothetical protein H0W50_03500, partial [Parachlamydiaceae bacterium]|nr:hypothetical protein [Parachlamydiaceae bacterium]
KPSSLCGVSVSMRKQSTGEPYALVPPVRFGGRGGESHSYLYLVLVHNHPSGDPTPSKEDYEVTELLVKAGVMMSIPIQDHLIIGNESYVSLRQKGFSFS